MGRILRIRSGLSEPVTWRNSVGNIVKIQLTDFQTLVEVPKLHIVKYGSDGITVINETT